MITFIQHIDPEYEQLKHATRTTLAAVIAFILYHEYLWPQSYWLILPAVFILQAGTGSRLMTRLLFVTVTGISAATATLIAGYLAASPWSIAFFVALMTAIGIYLGTLSQPVATAAFFITVLTMMSCGMPTDSSGYQQRAIMMLFSTVIDLLLCCLFFPPRYRFNTQRAFIAVSKALTEYWYAIFHCYEQEDYLQKQYHYENQLQIHHRALNEALARLQSCLSSHQTSIQQRLLTEICDTYEHLDEMVTEIGCLRYRVDDFALFTLIQSELRQLMQVGGGLLTKLEMLVKNPELTYSATEDLQPCLEALEQLIERVLSITAKQPSLFIIFLHNFREFSHQLDDTALLLRQFAYEK